MYLTIDQLMIVILGISSIVCISSTNIRLMRFGFLFGVLAEPFWMYSAIMNNQWGIFYICIVYMLCHIRGYLNAIKQVKHEQV